MSRSNKITTNCAPALSNDGKSLYVPVSNGNFGSGTGFFWSVLWLVALFLIATRAPNSLDLMRQFEPALHYMAPKSPTGVPTQTGWSARIAGLQLRMSKGWATVVALFFVLGSMGLNRISEFLYWQF